MDDNLQFARFLKCSAAVTSAGALLVVLLVATVDPYHLFGLVDVAGFNHVKPSPEHYQQQIKLAQARRMRANAIFLGNSRTEIGIDPDNPRLAARGYSAYNLALSGTGIATARQEFSKLRKQGAAPALAVIGVEFQDFLLDPADRPAARASSAAGHGEQPFGLQWRVDTLFSMTAAADAVKTLRIQHNPEAETMTARGFNPLLEYGKYARIEGYYSIFQQRALENAGGMLRLPHALVRPATGSSDDLATLHAMLLALAGDGTETHLVIYPYHAQLLAMFEQAGLWPAFEEWKGLLVREVDAIRRQHSGARIVLWDFSGFSAIQCERIPAKGDTRSATRWYWEAGHFKPAVGDLMLGRVLGLEADGAGRQFGVALDAASLERNRARIAAERARCAADYPELFADTASLIAAARK